MSMLFPRSVTFPSSRHLKTAESGTSMMSFLARNAELTGNFGGSPQGTFFIHDGHLESTEMCKNSISNFFHAIPSFVFVKFIYSEEATKFCEIFTLLLSNVVPVKSKVKILQNFVTF